MNKKDAISVKSLSDAERKQRDRVLKGPLYAPGEGCNGYKQKIMKKISYCEDFVYFLYHITNFNMKLHEFVSFDSITGHIWCAAHNCCQISDGCTSPVAYAYNVTEFSNRKVEIMSELLGSIIPRPIINIITMYYEDKYPNSNILAFCKHHLDDMYDNPNLNMVMLWDEQVSRWYISTHRSPESLL